MCGGPCHVLKLLEKLSGIPSLGLFIGLERSGNEKVFVLLSLSGFFSIQVVLRDEENGFTRKENQLLHLICLLQLACSDIW